MDDDRTCNTCDGEKYVWSEHHRECTQDPDFDAGVCLCGAITVPCPDCNKEK